MSGESAQVKSPLIGHADDDAASRDTHPGNVVIDVTNEDGESVELQTRTTKNGKDSRPKWVMRYHDIVPGKYTAASAKSFSDLIKSANEWLAKNPDKRLTSCEAVTWLEKEDKSIDSEYMISSRRWAEDCIAYNVRGLRLWLVPAKPDEKRTTLHYTSITPDSIYDTRDHLLEKLNNKLGKGEITGQLVQVETLPAPILGDKVSPEALFWSDNSNDPYRRAWYLAVYFADTGDAPKALSAKDFLPKQTNDGYETFESLVERSNDWLKQQSGCDVVSIQSFMVTREIDEETDPGFKCYWAWPSVKDARMSDIFRMLRIFVTSDKSTSGYAPTEKGIAFESFTPKLVSTRQERGSGRERAERMSETFHRLAIYLEASDVQVLGIETTMNPVKILDNPDSEKPDLDIKLLFTLRAYITNESALNYHKSQQLSRAGSQRRQGSFRHSSQRKTKKKQSNEGDRPGPIFLGNVVNRRYKYRWIVVGVTAFVVMSAIVILSVIYSNT